MKKLSVYIATIALLMITGVSCKKDFGKINTDPSIVTTPDVKFLLTYAEERMVTYQGTEWVWESMEQLLRYTQHVTSDPYEVTGNVNSRYSVYYQSILPNLFEIRRQIGLKDDKDAYQKMAMITYILQVCHGIKVTDMNGSIPYSEANMGRYESKYDPVYDTQETLFNTWLTQLDNAIDTLSDNSLPEQQTYSTADIFYKSDWTKWIKLANTLKLRIAARLENQDATKAKTIFQEVMTDATGPIDNDDTQLSYVSQDYTPQGDAVNYRSIRYATTSIMKFLKGTNDPRLKIYFEDNDLVGAYKDSLTKYNVSLPSFIDPNDPLIQYQGGPADWTTNPTVAAYLSNPISVGPSKYFLISPISRKFFSPRQNGAVGDYIEMLVSNAESCLLIAEFIEKGYGDGIDTKGSAEDWYKKGVTSSINTMNNIAAAANSVTAFSGDGSTIINNYLTDEDIALDGTNDLERIYIQEYLNLYRNPSEAFVFARRTGYPKKTSTYYAREVFNDPIPRRWWLTDPGAVNRDNWNAALSAEGFTPNAQDIPTLNSQRIWYDKNAPDFGEGQ
ncbi:MAG: SusD/RagB family nutrient-binding outer membrane lipoprotein [Agriterribacter sp.]